MALGFGFNKTKVLRSAEKYVQQGKLQNAIGEYEKVLKEDPRDLTVMNTLGDLYSRVGRADQAIQYFKRVGDAYASDGFTVKAIAMYKKVAKVDPSAGDYTLKLAELYSQQGLFSDARAQYVQVADQYLRAGKLQEAALIFHKMLEMDAENAALQSRLADLYLKMGKHEAARNIYLNAAQSLHSRGALDGADNALARVLALDPDYTPALLLRGQIACEAGNAAAAVEFLEKLPNVDSQPEALRALLRSHLQLGNTPEAVPLANKLLAVHNELGGIIAVGNALMAAGEFEGALRLYSQHGERLLAANTAGLLEGLYACIERIKENAEALQLLRDLFQKAGETAHLNEVTELLAHACVHSGELFKARDYYQQLSEVEPENPLHAQNYRQIVARLGEDSATRQLTEEERGQAFMVDELEISAPAIEQEYPEEIAAAVRSALTDSELLDSYNLPAKAIPSLEAALPYAPQDAMLNQRLASLYARVERFSEAAHCCEVLHDVYSQAGYADLAGQYADMAAKYHERVGKSPSEPAPHADVIPMPLATPLEAELSPQPAEPVGAQAPTAARAWDTPPHDTHAHEIEASHDWERLVSVEPVEVLETAQTHAGASPESAVAERLEEIRFYLAQSMLDEAEAAIATCARLAPAAPELAALREQLAAARAGEPAAPEIEVEIQEVPPETASPQPSISALVFDETALGLTAPKPAHDEVASPAVERPVTDIRPPLIQPPPILAPPLPLAQPAAAAATDVLGNFALELDRSLGADFSLAPPPSPRVAQPAAARITGAAIQQQTATAVAEPVAPPTASAAAPALGLETSAPASASPLADIFEAFKQGLEEGKGEETDDPETHYNLGIAFREMGLVDEAIGELQKVCQAIERGFPFPHAIQAYTWLAHCLCDKGVPQAAVKWYEKALRLSNLDDESRLGVYYELASAHEAAGNRQAALANFMEVYATNIDYRDVAERIKSLKS